MAAPYDIVVFNTVLDAYADYWRANTDPDGSITNTAPVTNELVNARVALALYADYMQNGVQDSLDKAEDQCGYLDSLKDAGTKLWENTDNPGYESLINNMFCCLALYLVGDAAGNATLKSSATETIGKFFDGTFPYNAEAVGGWYPSEKDGAIEAFNQNMSAAAILKKIGDLESNGTWTGRAYDLGLRVEDQQNPDDTWDYTNGGSYRHQYHAITCRQMAWAALEWPSDSSLLQSAKDGYTALESKQDNLTDYDGWIDSHDAGGNPTDVFYCRETLEAAIGYWHLARAGKIDLEDYNYDKLYLVNYLRRYDSVNAGIEYRKTVATPRNCENGGISLFEAWDAGLVGAIVTKGTTDLAFKTAYGRRLHLIDSAADWDEGTTLTDVETPANHSGKLVLVGSGAQYSAKGLGDGGIISKTFAPSKDGLIVVWAYDTGTDNNVTWHLLVYDDSGDWALLGVRWLSSNTHYTFGYNGAYTVGAVARSIGWHKFEIDTVNDVAKVDGTTIKSGIGITEIASIHLRVYSAGNVIYWDDVDVCGGEFEDDFEDGTLDKWTEDSTGTGSVAVSTDQNHTPGYEATGLYESKALDTGVEAPFWGSVAEKEVLNGQTLTWKYGANSVAALPGAWYTSLGDVPQLRYFFLRLEFSGDGEATPEAHDFILGYAGAMPRAPAYGLDPMIF